MCADIPVMTEEFVKCFFIFSCPLLRGKQQPIGIKRKLIQNNLIEPFLFDIDIQFLFFSPELSCLT